MQNTGTNLTGNECPQRYKTALSRRDGLTRDGLTHLPDINPNFLKAVLPLKFEDFIEPAD